jgi:hypothetical protein
MSWKELGLLVPTIVVLQMIRARFGENARLLVLAGLLGMVLIWCWWARRQWTRRITKLERDTPSAQEAALKSMPTEDRSAARIVLGLVTSAQAQVDPVRGEVFDYPRTPEPLLLATFWVSVVMSGLPLSLLALGRVQPDQIWWALALGVGFGIAARATLRSRAAQRAVVRISPAGVHSERADGRMVGILWSEMVLVRNRPLWARIEIWSADGRCIRVDYTLRRFARFMELLVAYARYIDERAARSTGGS